MIVLTSTTNIQATLDGTASTALECVATYVDTDASGSTFNEITAGVTFNTIAATTLVSSPAASTNRIVRYLAVTNTDSSVRIVTLTTNSRIIARVTLQIGDTWTFGGVYDSSGAVRHTVANSTFNSVFTALSRSVQLGTVSTNQSVNVTNPTTPRDLNILATLTGNITVDVTGLTAPMAGMTIKLDMTASGGARTLTINANGAQTLLWSVSGAGNVAGVTTARAIASGATDYIQMEWNGTRLVLQDDIARTANIPSDAVTTAKILNANVTYAKIQNVVNNNRFLGRVSGANGVTEEVTADQAITALNTASTSTLNLARLPNVTAQRLLGNATTGAIAPAEVIIHNNQTIATLAATSMSDATAGTGLSGTTALQSIQNYFRVTNDLGASIDSAANQIVTTGRLVGQTIILDMRASAASVTFTFPNAMPTENLASASALRVVPITNAANTRTKITLLWDGTRFNINFADYRTT